MGPLSAEVDLRVEEDARLLYGGGVRSMRYHAHWQRGLVGPLRALIVDPPPQTSAPRTSEEEVQMTSSRHVTSRELLIAYRHTMCTLSL